MCSWQWYWVVVVVVKYVILYVVDFIIGQCFVGGVFVEGVLVYVYLVGGVLVVVQVLGEEYGQGGVLLFQCGEGGEYCFFVLGGEVDEFVGDGVKLMLWCYGCYFVW